MPNYIPRLVGCEFAREKHDDLFAATPLLESLRAILAICARRQGGGQPHRRMALDVDVLPSMRRRRGMVAQLNFSFYGTTGAAEN